MVLLCDGHAHLCNLEEIEERKNKYIKTALSGTTKEECERIEGSRTLPRGLSFKSRTSSNSVRSFSVSQEYMTITSKFETLCSQHIVFCGMVRYNI